MAGPLSARSAANRAGLVLVRQVSDGTASETTSPRDDPRRPGSRQAGMAALLARAVAARPGRRAACFIAILRKDVGE